MSVGHRYDQARDTNLRARALAGILPRDPAGGTLLDFGAGSGWASELAAKRGWRVISVEAAPGPELLRRAQHPNITLVADTLTILEALELLGRARQPAGIIALSALHHLPNPPRALRQLLDARLIITIVELPHPLETDHQAIAGSRHIPDLLKATEEHWRDAQLVHRSPSAFVPAAGRPMFAWAPNVVAGTVVTGGGHSTREWSEAGAILAAELGLDLEVGTLNLELDRPLPHRQLSEVDTTFGPIRFHPIAINDIDAFALRMPRGHDPRGFTELVATVKLREVLELRDGTKVALRADPTG